MESKLTNKSWYAIALLFLSFQIKAQNHFPTNELSIGSQVPDFHLKIINYPSKEVSITDFKGKLLIIDFWATWCGGCIKETPRFDSLQNKFKDQIAILPVTTEKSEVVRVFLNKSKFLKPLSHIPVVTDDTLLYKVFKHGLIPHEIWVNKDGKVIAITESEEVNAKNIKAYLKSGTIDLPQKHDVLGWDPEKPLLFEGVGDFKISVKQLRYSSLLFGELKGVPSSSTYASKAGNTVKTSATNVSIQLLFQLPFLKYMENLKMWDRPDINLTYPNRLVWEAKDSTLFNWIGRSEQDWAKVPDTIKYFSYELILPAADSSQINQFALQDLNRFFGPNYGIEGLLEKRETKCYSLVRTTDIDLIGSKGGDPDMEIDNDKNLIHIRNYTINAFMMYWQSFQMYRTPIPIIDETGYTFPIDLNIDANIRDIPSLNYALRKYGLEFKLVERPLEMIVIRDIRK